MSGNPPEMLLGRYRLEEVVGTGGMGTVARAHDEVLHRTIAIKLLRDELAHDPNTVERFRREARIAASLSHPGIAQVYDFGEENGRSFIVMEFLDGEDLHSILAREGTLHPAAAAQIVASAAEALEHAHQAGAIHRDIKPGNIFLTTSGEVKVTDFGIARAASELPLTVAGLILGTFLYMSPEQASGEPSTAATDVYCLGCVLFHLLTGKPPFEGDSPMAIPMAHISTVPPRVTDLNPQVPAGLAAVVAQALEKKPEDRFQSAGAMAAALRRGVVSETEHPTDSTVVIAAGPRTEILQAQDTSPPPRREGEPPKTRSRWRPIVAVVALALVIGAVAIGAARLRGDGSLEVPRFTGMRIEAARAQAGKLGLKVGDLEEPSQGTPGEVVRQEPPAGTKVSPGASVTLYVATDKVRVPVLENLTLDQAKAALGALGLQLKVIARVAGEKDEIVVDQDPESGTLVARGSEVRLTISERKGKGKGKGEG